MVQKTETLVIGGGAIGVCCAFYLNRLGKKVLLAEKKDICSGSSHGNAGLIVPSYSMPLAAPGVIGQGLKWMTKPHSPFYIKPRLDWNLLAWLWKFGRFCTMHHVRHAIPVLFDLHTASFKLYEDLATIEGMDFALEKRGLLELFITQKGYDKGIKNTALLEEYGVANKVLAQNELSEFLEGIQTPAVGGVYRPQDVHLIPDRFVHQLAGRLEKTGVRLMTSCEVLDFLTSGRRVRGIKTTRGDILAEEIVIAGGAWSAGLARNLQLKLAMQPAKGYSITFRRPAQSPPLPVALAESKVVLTPMADMLRVAGTLELAGFDQTINLGRVQAILNTVRAYFPDLDPDSFQLLEIWQGLRPCSPDGLPYIGRTARYDNVILATGHGMLGISLAPITGKIVSQLSVNETPAINPAALSVERLL
jgi:D-amino-acid dehydrogenase